MAESTLTPRQAEQLVEDKIQRYGLDALPHVSVQGQPGGRWRIEWRDHVKLASAMTHSQWENWLERNVGAARPERLASTEG